MSQTFTQTLAEALAQLDGLIRSGKASDARILLKKLTLKEIPRALIQPLATIARRADMPGLGLKLLNPVVRPERKKIANATDMEKIEYAFCLSNSGAQQEAIKLLDTLDIDQIPQGLLAKSFSYINSWNYKEAIPLLKTYTASPQVEAYQRLVGNVNLVAALVYEELSEEAEELLGALLEETEKGQYRLLHGKLLGYRAQNAIQAKKWEVAGKFLGEAEDYLKEMGGIDVLLMKKWHAVYDCYLQGEKNKNVDNLRKIKEEAYQIKHWETVRHCDFFEALFCENEELGFHVYFGTPYTSFKHKLLKEWKKPLSLPEQYALKLGSPSPTHKKIRFLIEEAGEKALKHGQASHRAMLALASDFYRPLRVTTLHYALYPNDFFNPFSSRDRVHQALRRLRISLKNLKLPLTLKEEKSLYSLAASSPIELLVPREIESKDRSDFQIQSLQAKWPTDPFSVSQAADHLQVETRTALIFLQKALQKGIVVRSGKGPATRYCFFVENMKAAA